MKLRHLVHPPSSWLAVLLLVSCTEKEASQPALKATTPDAIETLWVADQFTGFLGTWTRKQQRCLITPSKVFFQKLDLTLSGQVLAEVFSGEYGIVSHRKNQHGGVFELGSGSGELLTIVQEFDETSERMGAPKRSMEQFDVEEGADNSLLAYRWLGGGRVDLVDVYPEEEPGAAPLDAEAVLASLADPKAFDAYRWVDEESLLPGSPEFVNFAELREFGETLKDLPEADDSAFQRVSAALDERWKGVSNGDVPDHLAGIGFFANAYLFGLVFHEAMIDAGYHPYFSAFAFAKYKDEENLDPDSEEEDRELLESLKTRFDPYVGFFEGSLRAIVDAPNLPTSLPTYITEKDRQTLESGADPE